jgi:hypothetical protein
MASISLEAFDSNLRGKYTQWVLPSQDFCALPNGFQDQILSGTPAFQTTILLMSKQDSRAWHIAYSWDMTFIPETPTDWSLLVSIIQHLKKPILIVTTPKCIAPAAFWQKCISMMPTNITPTCVSLKDLNSDAGIHQTGTPYSIFFPKLDTITESQFMKIPSTLSPTIQPYIQSLDLRSLYRDLRGAGASLCLSLTDSRPTTDYFRGSTQSGSTQNGTMLPYTAMWFYPENNGALRLHISDLRMILRTVTERLSDS